MDNAKAHLTCYYQLRTKDFYPLPQCDLTIKLDQVASYMSFYLTSLCYSPLYLELILLVFGAFVKGTVISEPPNVIELVEAFDVVRHSVSLQHILTLWDWGYSIDLQVWMHRMLRKA